MKVLFILSGNRDKSSNLVMNQALSICSYNENMEIDYFFVKGKGLSGYLKNVPPLREKIRSYNPDVVHAHYSFCGFLSFLSFSGKPVVTSLMGSDLHLKMHWRFILFVVSAFWRTTIVKSETMQKKYLLSKTCVIPNGVDFNSYEPIEKGEARKLLGLKLDKNYILFLADPERPEKNFKLAKEACSLIRDEQIELLVINNIPHEQTRLYYYAVDVLILSSFYEGSPNVIKEAMVCNCPIVSTNVGDVASLFEGVEGNFISGYHAYDFSAKIQMALQFSRQKDRTRGREKISGMGINAEKIAKKIYHIYQQIL